MKCCNCFCWTSKPRNDVYESLIADEKSDRTSQETSRISFGFKSSSSVTSDKIFRDHEVAEYNIHQISFHSTGSNDSIYSEDNKRNSTIKSLFSFLNVFSSSTNESNDLDDFIGIKQVEEEDSDDIDDEYDRNNDQINPNLTTSLERALQTQRMRSQASDPGLAPRGPIVTTIPRSLNKNNQQNAINFFEHKLLKRVSEPQDAEDYSSCEVEITRWALRRDEVPFNKGQKSPPKVVNYSEKLSDSSGSRSSSVDKKEDASEESVENVVARGEIEYEICISDTDTWRSVSGISNSATGLGITTTSAGTVVGGDDSERTTPQLREGGGEQGTVRKVTKESRKWKVWRSARDVIILHAILVTALGDHAPRRPRLHTNMFISIDRVSQSGAELNESLTSDIKHDMRTITVFIKALLRQTSCTSLAAVTKFLGINDKKPLVLSYQNGNNSNDGNADKSEEGRDSIISNFVTEQSDVGGRDAQSKWRKVFTNLRVRLKPHEIAIRTRLFSGVVCAIEIVNALLALLTENDIRRASTLDNDSENDENLNKQQSVSQVHNRAEASVLAQELVSCGLLVSVTGGIGKDSKLGATNPVFCDDRYCLYRFATRSTHSVNLGSYSIFGAPVKITIPRCVGSIAPASGNESSSNIDNENRGNNSLIYFVISITHCEDTWEVHKREEDFSAFNKSLQRYGMSSLVQYPTRSMLSYAFGSGGNTSALSSKLEAFANATIQWVMKATLEDDVKSQEVLRTCAEFFDNDFNKLILY